MRGTGANPDTGVVPGNEVARPRLRSANEVVACAAADLDAILISGQEIQRRRVQLSRVDEERGALGIRADQIAFQPISTSAGTGNENVAQRVERNHVARAGA